MKERVAGVMMLLAGAVLSYLCIYRPLESAWNGKPEVSISLKGVFLVPVGLIGLLYLVLGPRVTAVLGTREEPKPAAYVLGIGFVALGIGLYFWLRSTLQAYGYDFQGRF